MEATTILGVLLLGAIAGLIVQDAKQREMEYKNWGTASVIACLFVVPIYMLVRNRKEKSQLYTKTQIRMGTALFLLGLIIFAVLVYNQIIIPYQTGTFDILDTNIVVLVSFISVYIFAAIALKNKDLGMMAFGFYSIFIVLIIYLIMLLNYNVSGYHYNAYKDRVVKSSGYVFGFMLEGFDEYRSVDISVYDMLHHNYSGIAVEGRDRIIKNDKYGLYYKNHFITPFTGVSVTLEDESYIKEAVYYDNGRLDEAEYFRDDGTIEKIEYYGSGQIKTKSIRKNGDLCGEYSAYYKDGQLEDKIEPYNGRVDGLIKIKHNNGGYPYEVIDLVQGKRTYFHENGELNVQLIYEDGKLKPRKYYDDKGRLISVWEDLPLSRHYASEKEKYRIISGIGYDPQGRINFIEKELLYRYASYADYHSQHDMGYYFEYEVDDYWITLTSKECSDGGSHQAHMELEAARHVKGGGNIELEFYGADIKTVGKESDDKKIGSWVYYYPDGTLACRELYSDAGIYQRGEYFWGADAQIKITANEKGDPIQAIVEFPSRGLTHTYRYFDDIKDE